MSSIRLFKFGKVATNMRSRPTKGKQLLSKEASVGAQAGKHWLVGWVGRGETGKQETACDARLGSAVLANPPNHSISWSRMFGQM